jgi:hypothetical protein
LCSLQPYIPATPKLTNFSLGKLFWKWHSTCGVETHVVLHVKLIFLWCYPKLVGWIVADPRQHVHSWFRDPLDSWSYSTVLPLWDSETLWLKSYWLLNCSWSPPDQWILVPSPTEPTTLI